MVEKTFGRVISSGGRRREKILKPGDVYYYYYCFFFFSLRCLRHDYINILMPVAVHNAVNCSLEEKKTF